MTLRASLALITAALCCLAYGCSRAPSDGAAGSSAAPTAATPVTPASSIPATPPALDAADAPAIPTPEDVEDDAEHRITEQNLESELDRLEREIQAE